MHFGFWTNFAAGGLYKYLIAFEIGCNQGEDIKQLALKYFGNCEVIIEKDIQGKDRFCFIKN